MRRPFASFSLPGRRGIPFPQKRRQSRHRPTHVRFLRSFVGDANDETRRHMANSNRRRCFVDVLSARTTGPHRRDFNVPRVHDDVRFVHHGCVMARDRCIPTFARRFAAQFTARDERMRAQFADQYAIFAAHEEIDGARSVFVAVNDDFFHDEPPSFAERFDTVGQTSHELPHLQRTVSRRNDDDVPFHGFT